MKLENKALDEAIFPLITKNNSQYRKRFRINNWSEYKKSVINSESSIKPAYPLLDDRNFNKKVVALENFKELLISDNSINEVVKKLYIDKILEKIKLLNLVRSAFIAQRDTKEGRVAINSFREITEEVFGVPRLDIFQQLVNHITEQHELLSDNLKNTPAYSNLNNLLSRTLLKSLNNYPNLGGSVDVDISESVADADIVVAYFTGKMRLIGLNDWTVLVSEKPIGSFRVQVDKKTVLVPKSSVLKNRKMGRRLTTRVLEGIFNHEILTHVVRSVNGEQSTLKLLSIGLAGYLKGEEGIATYREQLCSPHNDYSGGTMYFAIGLAYGLDRGGKKRSFTEVYEILCDYFFLKHEGESQGFKSKAFSTCCRIFVLSADPESPLVFTHDVVYRHGNIEINNLITAEPQSKNNFDIGKFDPCNLIHVTSLKVLGLIKT